MTPRPALHLLLGLLLAAPLAARAAPPVKTVAVVVDETVGTQAPPGSAPEAPEPSDEVATLLTRALMAAGWTVILPPPCPPIVRAPDARDLGRLANAAYVVFGRVRFSKHQLATFGGLNDDPTSFPATGVFELTVVSTADGVVLGASTGKLNVATPGAKGSDGLSRTNVSHDRTIHDIVHRFRKDELLTPVLEALEGHAPAASAQGGSR